MTGRFLRGVICLSIAVFALVGPQIVRAGDTHPLTQADVYDRQGGWISDNGTTVTFGFSSMTASLTVDAGPYPQYNAVAFSCSVSDINAIDSASQMQVLGDGHLLRTVQLTGTAPTPLITVPLGGHRYITFKRASDKAIGTVWVTGPMLVHVGPDGLPAPIATARPTATLSHTTARAGTVQALLARAQAAFDKGDYVTAQALFTQATTLAPHNAVAWAGKARSEAYNGDDADAVADYTVAVHYAPANAVYYLRRGVSYVDLGDASHALADYMTAIRLAPTYADPYYDLGAFYYNLGEYALSITNYTRAIQLRPAWWSAYYYRTQGENNVGSYQAAIADATTYIRHTKRAECGCAYTERGNAYFYLQQYAKALADYQQAIAIDRIDSGEYNNYGAAAYYLKKYDLAISHLSEAIALDPADARAYYYRGLARRDSGDKLAAITDEQQAVQLYTQQGNTEWAQQAATVLQQLQQLQTAA